MSEQSDIVDWVTTYVPSIAGRIYPIDLPAAPVLPSATYQLVSANEEPDQDGAGMIENRYRFKVWAEKYIELDPVIREFREAFNARHDGPFRGSLTEGSFEDRDRQTRRYWRIVDVLGWQPASLGLGS